MNTFGVLHARTMRVYRPSLCAQRAISGISTVKPSGRRGWHHPVDGPESA